MLDILRTWWIYAVVLVAVGMAALLPWLRTRAIFPDEPLDVSVIYRDPSGDIQYFPLIAQLARGTATDESVKEAKGTVLRSFPYATLIPHALCMAMFGPSGFPVADVLVSVAYLLLVYAFFRVLGVSKGLCALCGLILALPIALVLHVVVGVGPFVESSPLLAPIWGMRIPRPFVSELYMLAVLVAAIRLLTRKKMTRARDWVLLFSSLALLVQGDVHAALIFILASPVLMLLVLRRDGVAATGRHCAVGSAVFLLLVGPFIAQRTLEQGDIPVRWGVFEINRLAGISHIALSLPVLIFAITILVVAHVQVRANQLNLERGGVKKPAFLSVSPVLVALLISSCICFPVSAFFLGKTIQPYHFVDRAERIATYLILSSALILLDVVCVKLQHRERKDACLFLGRGWVWRGTIMLLIVAFFGHKLVRWPGPSGFKSHLRHHYYAHTQIVPGSYRRDFTDLTRYLDEHVAEDSVIASFDHQVFAWWLTFHRGYWFLVEPFVSSLPDAELELRLALFCNTLEMTPVEYEQFLQQRYVNTFWLGLAKYQASRWHSYSEKSDYTDEQLDAIENSWSVWQLIIPASELHRLRHDYVNLDSSKMEDRALDVIVLSAVGPESKFQPAEEAWRLAYRNSGFRVYLPRD